ncbi:aspartate aminotransferase family protein [Conexibacter woesei]|uniref:Aminotransferase class-III n=1 Tax=Conexibacter woesei (strain DSM 14684 / CCUG 47730 / CIP 108061 / JCM 11494 / NBRC 100937 / ID131577) TaxID=469383 RepID=D3F992_CONWI|nr:aspartate aminotransferase family protein [Conexibacter woesei]ADB49059.1 aminotransferase class-III [Conexibacter woesei DSM 14684]
MSTPTPGAAPTTAADAYSSATERSRLALGAARRRLPTGLSRQTLVFAPHPFVARRGDGAYLEDLDGRRYLDFVNNYTSLIHGHSHEPSRRAMDEAFARSPAPGAPTALELDFAEEIARRVGSIEWVRFAVTGTEAVLYALRAARAFTGRRRILKFEGGFHGGVDDVQVSIGAAPMEAGTFGPGIPATGGLGTVDTVVAVYNDSASLRAAMAAHRDELAAVIVEPFLGNAALIAAHDEFLAEIRQLTTAAGALMVLDEIQSCRLGYGGAQERLAFGPDLTTMGKTIGGGTPLALVGGRRDVMEVFDGFDPAVRQTGTFNAFPASLAAGLATLTDWQRDDVERLNARGRALREELTRVFAAHGVAAHVGGQGSMFNISLIDRPVATYRDFAAADASGWQRLHHELLVRGVYLSARGTGCLSTAMQEADVARLVAAMDDALSTVENDGTRS